MNHSTVSSLNWRTPIELLDGHTPDISVFRFSFFQPVWYYEPTAKYLDPNFRPRRFVGIAWNHGDAFTYRIWACPSGKSLAEGTELIRNIVKPRNESDGNTLPSSLSAQWDLEMRMTRKTRKRKNRSRSTDDLPETTSALNSVLVPSRVYFSTAAPTDSGDSEEQGGTDRSNTNRKVQPSLTETMDDEHHDDAATFDNNQPIDLDEASAAINGPEMVEEVNAELEPNRVEEANIGGAASIIVIKDHRWKLGQLELRVKWDTDETTWEEFKLMKVDHPRLTAEYLVGNKVSRKRAISTAIEIWHGPEDFA